MNRIPGRRVRWMQSAKTGMVPVLAGLLLLCGTESMPAQTSVNPDSVMTVVRSLYDQGSYLSAEVEARRMLDNRSLPDSIRIRAEQYLAFSLVAQAKNAVAAEHFIEVLKIDSTFALDPVLTSPKILTVFADARRQFAAMMGADPDAAGIARHPTDHRVTFRAVVFPGWEQVYQGKPTKGYTLVGAGILALGLTMYFDQERRNARDAYLEANTPDLAASKYARYNNFYKAEYYSIGAFVVLYVYSQLDAFLDLPPHIDPTLSRRNSSLQLTVHVPF
jgi:hypothetical protein